ncbi:hypothetical protein OLEAN_C17240 [Oleispira antarctica RB-8]|uniref:Uncharacterized protein n=1 Tax=Oleispira antarctica RB-8 TaxID=698738 RepID=R4YME3_OLEAN|nr:hypothetical protein OLEAN_C17240 [Oleispira antarctica RB-8]
MNYLTRQKIEIIVIAALYMLPTLYCSIAFDINLAIAIGLAVVAYVTTTGFLTLLRTDDMPDSYGSKWDYPPLLLIYFVFLGILTCLSW